VLNYDAGAGKAGYAGFMVTVDAPRLGNRIADERNKYVNDAMFSIQLTPSVCTSLCARCQATRALQPLTDCHTLDLQLPCSALHSGSLAKCCPAMT